MKFWNLPLALGSLVGGLLLCEVALRVFHRYEYVANPPRRRWVRSAIMRGPIPRS